MALFSVEIPDELAKRLESLGDRLPGVLMQVLESNYPSTSPQKQSELGNVYEVYTEVLDFLLKSPTPEQILSFKVSTQAQQRLQNLLEKNRSGMLTIEEHQELDVYEQLEHLMILLKARAIG